MRFVFLALFAAFSAVHLVHSWQDNARLRARTKPFLLLFLLLWYVTAAKEPLGFLIAALAFSWLGDVLLIPKGNKWFTAGGIAFMVSHLFFVLTYLPEIRFDRIIWWILIPAAAVYTVVSWKIILALMGTTPKKMLLPMHFYLICNSVMNVCSLAQLMSLRSAGAWIAYIGAVLFFVSDCCLFLVRYHRNKDLVFKKHFTVMLTYLLGEFLICLGMLRL